MKITMDQKNFSRYGEDKYNKIVEYGFDAVCWAMCDTIYSSLYTKPEEEMDPYLLSEREKAEKAGLKFSHCHGPWRVPWPDETEEGLNQKIKDTKRAIHNTKVLGAEYCVVHPFLPCGINEINDSEKSKISFETNVRVMKELTEFAAENNVILCFENMPMLNFSVAKPADIVKVVEAVNHPNCQVCLDTGHANIYNELTMDSCVKTTAKYLKVLHVHDNFYNMDLHLFPTQGNTDWASFSKALKEIKFDGLFELEISPKQQLPEHLYTMVIKLLKGIADHVISLADEN
ncbi:MAG: sugar phosphate isomerase/epimerase [Clostridia bacterium]|nr:sugar phosphate isomerase/epimerase [Clostridia bacterium]